MNIRKLKQHKRAFTLLEMIISMAIVTTVGIAEVSLILMTARTQNRGYVEMRVFKNADYIQDYITGVLQGASSDAGVFFHDPDGAYYNTIIIRDSIYDYNEKIRYNPENKTLVYDPDMSAENDEVLLSDGDDSLAVLEDMGFRAAMKEGGIPDSGLILVRFRVTDHGKGKITYRDPDNEYNWITSRRNFAVGLRK